MDNYVSKLEGDLRENKSWEQAKCHGTMKLWRAFLQRRRKISPGKNKLAVRKAAKR